MPDTTRFICFTPAHLCGTNHCVFSWWRNVWHSLFVYTAILELTDLSVIVPHRLMIPIHLMFEIQSTIFFCAVFDRFPSDAGHWALVWATEEDFRVSGGRRGLATYNKLIFIQGHLWLALDNLDIFWPIQWLETGMMISDIKRWPGRSQLYHWWLRKKQQLERSLRDQAGQLE